MHIANSVENEKNSVKSTLVTKFLYMKNFVKTIYSES